MSLISIKKKNGVIHLDGDINFLIGSFVFALLFGAAYLSTKNVLQSLVFSVPFTIVTLVITTAIEHFGKKRHNSIHNSSTFLDFYSRGFEQERIGEYNGLITLWKQRSVRCYYEWSRLSIFPPCFGNIVFVIYFKPLIDNMYDLNVDQGRIDHLNAKYGTNGRFGSYRRFDVDRLVLGMSFNSWMTPQRFISILEKALIILTNEELAAIDIKSPEHKEASEKSWFLPNTQLIREWQETQTENNANKQ